MAKYADITPFYEWLDWLEKESNSRCPEYNTMMFYEIRDKLDDLPEVVLCKDCKYWRDTWVAPDGKKEHGYCYMEECDDVTIGRWDDDFCSYGERKDNG